MHLAGKRRGCRRARKSGYTITPKTGKRKEPRWKKGGGRRTRDPVSGNKKNRQAKQGGGSRPKIAESSLEETRILWPTKKKSNCSSENKRTEIFRQERGWEIGRFRTPTRAKATITIPHESKEGKKKDEIQSLTLKGRKRPQKKKKNSASGRGEKKGGRSNQQEREGKERWYAGRGGALADREKKRYCDPV